MQIRKIIKKRIIIILSVLVLSSILVFSYLKFNYTYVDVKTFKKQNNYGIIDSSLSIKHRDSRIIYHELVDFTSKQITHGDALLDFSKYISNTSEIYYYDAFAEKGGITSASIISGLNWMLDNNVKKVNISLSTAIFSADLRDWIKENHEEIKIYASYNNKLNTCDYPAMYEYVIGSGSNDKINFKDIDRKYINNAVILSNHLGEKYVGNSYLSILTLVRDK